MADVNGLFGHNTSGGTDTLIAVFGGDIVNVTTGVGFNQNVSPTSDANFEAFLDRAWFVNGTNGNRNFDGSSWTITGVTTESPIAKYIKRIKDKLYTAYVTIRSQDYPSRVWFSDLPKNTGSGYTLTWDYVTQENLRLTAGSNAVVSPGATFITNGIKVGDPITITTGDDADQFTVASVPNETTLTLNKNMKASNPASTYWVGGNWFDVAPDDNDVITGLGENSDKLLIFKRDSLYRFGDAALRLVKGVPGTTSGRSIVNIKDFTFYFHRTGIYRYDGVTSTLISRGIQAYVDGISSSNFDKIVGWKVAEDTYRCFVGDLDNSAEDISQVRAFFDYDIPTQTWSVGTYPVTPLVATTFIESQDRNTYFGTTTDEVFQDNVSNNDDNTDIAWRAETVWHFPYDSLAEAMFTRIRVFTRFGRGINVRYKLYGTPTTISKDWISLGDVRDFVTEFKISDLETKRAKGIKLLFTEISSEVPLVIEKVLIYSTKSTERMIE